MNESAVRVLAQQDPVPTMTASAGTLMSDARRKVDSLTDTLRQLDGVLNVLKKQHKVTVEVDLGPIGNAAAAARRDLERERPTTFELPR